MNFLSTLIFFTLCWPLVNCNSDCKTPGWFGPDCKYQCHCENNICNPTSGRCASNVKCAKGWFGSNCQYQDLATILNSKVTSNPRHLTDRLFDRNDLSCNNQNNLQFIRVFWDESFRFNWLSIIFNKGNYKETLASLSRIKLTFKTSSSNQDPCIDKQTSFVDNDTMIVKCSLTEDVQEINMTGDGVKSMCSLYISGGRNVALKQQTNQTSTYERSFSDRAVDGDTSGKWDTNRCTHSNDNRTTPKWTLTFDTPMIISRFFIYNRVDNCCVNRLQKFQLETLDNKSVLIQSFTNDMSIKNVYVVPVQHDKTNVPIKSLRISSANSSTILTLCEVEAYGDCPPGKWGLDCKGYCPRQCEDTCNKETGLCHFCYGYKNPPYCTEDCNHGTYGLNCIERCPISCNDSVCDALTGYCTSCLPGFKGNLCNKKCESGTWGINCSKLCEYKCVDKRCNNENGDCKTGCKGYLDFPQCSQVCNPGNYGENCTRTCPENCYNRECNRVNGNCDICQPGYQGYWCRQVCQSGNYGINCTQTCPERCSKKKCNHVTGTCYSCVSGYQGNLCDKVCYSGSYGINCTQQCPENCHNRECHHDNGSCYSCEPGYHGNKCETACDSNSWGYKCKERCSANCLKKTCKGQNGHCSGGCQAGYELPTCTQECHQYRHGVNCSLKCSARCRDNWCSAKEGFCLSCYPGYQGQHCDQNCNATFYGQDCANQCNTSCIDQMCDPINGNCYNCSLGRHGDQCDICPSGRFGERCYKTCSAHCLVDTCHPEKGTCRGGCKDGYEGDTCIPVAATTSSSIVGGAVGSVIAVIVLLIVAGVILWRRRDDLIIKKDQKASRTERDNLGLSGMSSQGTSRERPISDIEYNNLQPVLQDTSIAIKDLNFFMISHSMEYFEDQFKSVPLPQNVTMEVAQNMENTSKNRYKNICTYDHSRVRLMINRDKNEGDYINASYIKGPDDKERFIASQGPTQIMMNDFVRMIWEHKVDTVVMLTNLIEEGKTKCVKYWPDTGEVKFGEISVKHTTTESFADYIIRSFQMFKGDREVTRSFTQFHFTSWPDKSVPATPWSLVEFLKRVSIQPTTSPMVVHCSAGVGRTGTFIALHNVIRQARDTGRVDFYQTLAKLRQDRILMIQTAEQYLFLHKAAQAAIVCIDTSVTSKDISDRIIKLTEKSIIGKTQLEEEFKGVCTACESFNMDTKDTIQEPDNDGNVYENSANVNPTLKNRFVSIIPKQRFRPYLSCESKDMGAYINAVFVPGFKHKDQRLLTQLPMQTTVVDFWRLVSQYDVSLIVAFEIDAMAKDESFGNYLPVADDRNLSCPPFEIISVVKKQEPLWEERRLKIDTERPKLSQPTSVAVSQSVIHIKCLFTDLSPKNLLSLVRQVRSYDAQAGGRTLYTCRNGAHYSGLICVLSLLLDRIEQDGTVCVPLVVGEIKSIRLEVIPTPEQYRVIYDVLVRYFQTSKHYENVGNGVSTKNMDANTVNKPTASESVDHDSNVYANT